MSKFVGRLSELSRLKSVLQGEIKALGKVTVQSIEGSGGIGKTSLFEHVLGMADLTDRHYLRMSVSGNDPASDLLVPTVARMVKSAQADAIRKLPPGYFFPSVDRVIRAIDAFRSEAISEFEKLHPVDDGSSSAFRYYLDRALTLGRTIGGVEPNLAIICGGISGTRVVLERIVPTMASLKTESGSVLFGKSRALRNAIRENACRPLAEAMLSNLSAILCRARQRDFWKLTHRPIHGISRLLLVIDDYERSQQAIGEFLVAHLVPSLKEAEFDSLIVILGRDDLQATSPAWDQNHQSCLLKPIRLDPLTKPDLLSLVESYGVSSAMEKERAWNDTQGYPYFVQLWCEEAELGGKSFVMLQRFHARTTRWMSDREKQWLELAAFLDRVNVGTLGKMMTDCGLAGEAMHWFEHEGSVRCTTGEYPRVREYIRSRLLDYLARRDPVRFEELRHRSTIANALDTDGSEFQPPAQTARGAAPAEQYQPNS